MGEDGIRLNKFLSGAGICSRREADRLIEEGKVTVDGRRAEPGQKVKTGQTVVCDGRTVAAGKDGAGERPERVLLAVHKPRGIVCTTSDKDRAPNIVDMVDYPVRIYPVGRLDKDSEGLILMTNQGELVNQMMRGANGHEKEYLVWVDRPVTPEMIGKLKKGVFLPELEVKTRPCFAEKTGEKSFRIILTQGLNRQIRRMCEQTGCHVKKLKRIRVMNIELGDLKEGEYRPVSKKEYAELMRLLKENTGVSDRISGNDDKETFDREKRGNEKRGQEKRVQGKRDQGKHDQGKHAQEKHAQEKHGGEKHGQGKRAQGKRGQEKRVQEKRAQEKHAQGKRV